MGPVDLAMELDRLSVGFAQAARVVQRHGHATIFGAVVIVAEDSPALGNGALGDIGRSGVVDVLELGDVGSRGGADESGCGREGDGLAGEVHLDGLLVFVAIGGGHEDG